MHDVYLVHGSEANKSDQPRPGITFRYMPTSVVFDRKLAKKMFLDGGGGGTDHSLRTLYLMRGVDECGKNDFLVRQ